MKGHIFFLTFDIQVFLKGRKLRKLRIYNDFFHFYFLNMDISLTIYVIDLRFSVYILQVLWRKRIETCFPAYISHEYILKISKLYLEY